ncbi:MAG: hypothetical protein WCK67_03840 [bacterium]
MPHYYLFKLKKNDVVFEFSSQDPKLMYSQFNKWAEELIGSTSKKIGSPVKKAEPVKVQQAVKIEKKQEPIIIETVKVVTREEYEAMQKQQAAPLEPAEIPQPVLKDYPEEFEEEATIVEEPVQQEVVQVEEIQEPIIQEVKKVISEQLPPPVKLRSLSLDDIDISTRQEPIVQQTEEIKDDFITFETIEKKPEIIIEEPSVKETEEVVTFPNAVESTSKFKLTEDNEPKAYEFKTFNQDEVFEEEPAVTDKAVEEAVINEKFKPSNVTASDASKDQFFKILQKKFSSIVDEPEVEEVKPKNIIKEELPPLSSPEVEYKKPEISSYTPLEEVRTAPQPSMQNKALDLKNLDNLIQLKKPDNMFDYLLIAAYYLKEGEFLDRYSLKQMNSKIFPYTRKPIDHSIIQKAVARNYIEVVPDYTGMAEVTEYVITDEGENYLINEL